MSFGETIAGARKKLTMSQKELATRIKKPDGGPISPQYLNDIEHGKRNPDSDEMIEEFARVLKIPSEILYFWARKLPADVKPRSVSAEKIEAAYAAFRRELKKT